MSLGTSNRDGGKTSESGHLRALGKIVSGDIITGLNAVQRAAGVNMSVDVQVGDAFVRRSDGTYAHPVFNDAVYNQVISAADGSNPRRDIVVIYVDYGQTPSTAVSNNTNGVVKIKVVNGTPAGSPVDPNGAAIQSSVGAGNPYSILARVRVPAGQTTISNSLIDDLRTMIYANTNSVPTASIQDNAVTSAKVPTNAITADKLATNAIIIGHTNLTTPFSTTSTSNVQITGMTSTVTIPAGGRKVRVTITVPYIYNLNAVTYTYMNLWQGTVGSGTQLQETLAKSPAAGDAFYAQCVWVGTLSAGSYTFNGALRCSGGTGNMQAGATTPAIMIVEMI